MTTHRMIALAMWLTAAIFIVASETQGADAPNKWVVMMFAALILLRICDLEDRVKRMGEDASSRDTRHKEDQ